MRRLTPRQKDCLRLVADGHQSKSIARELGISHLRVNKHIADARKILGTATRGEAAHLLLAWEQRNSASTDGPPWGAPSLGLPQNDPLLSKQTADDATEDMMEANVQIQPRPEESFLRAIGGHERLPIQSSRPGSRSDNDLGIPWTLALLIVIAAVFVAAGAIGSLLLSLSQPHR